MRKFLIGITTVAIATAGLLSSVGTASGQQANTPLADSQPAWATAGARVGATPSNTRITFRVYLALRDSAGASALAAAVSDPNSASFRHYLSTDQVRSRFAPSDASVAAVRSWLTNNGLTVEDVPANNQFVEASGTATQVANAFAVHLGQYRVRNHTLRAADRSLSVPASLAGIVTGVIGVDQALSLVHPNSTNGQTSPSAEPTTVAPPAGFRNAPPCSQYWGQHIATVPSYGPYGSQVPYAPCGYVPSQFRSVYGTSGAVAQGIDGTGTTVAIVDAFASPTIFQDASRYAALNDSAHPLKASQFHQLVFPTNHQLEGPDECDAAGWYGEETLDVEAVHGMAPGADILYVGGSDCQDISLDKALNAIVSGNLAQIVSNSYGDLGEDIPFGELQSFQNISVQAVIEGIGLYFSSGDDGDETDNFTRPTPDFSASSPWVTAVGGTSLGVGANGNRVLETGWETTKSTLTAGPKGHLYWDPFPGAFLYGSGGGTSRLFPEPFYQQGVVPNALAQENHAHGGRGRVVPDISVDGDPNTGMLVGETQTFPSGVFYDQYRIGGTSLSSPLFAGVMALADQYQHVRHGFINPSLYALAGTNAITDVTHVTAADIRVDYVNGVNAADGTTTSIRTFDDQSTSIHTKPGYDNVTGLGTPNGVNFLSRI